METRLVIAYVLIAFMLLAAAGGFLSIYLNRPLAKRRRERARDKERAANRETKSD
jgi:hypothetical protein